MRKSKRITQYDEKIFFPSSKYIKLVRKILYLLVFTRCLSIFRDIFDQQNNPREIIPLPKYPEKFERNCPVQNFRSTFVKYPRHEAPFNYRSSNYRLKYTIEERSKPKTTKRSISASKRRNEPFYRASVTRPYIDRYHLPPPPPPPRCGLTKFDTVVDGNSVLSRPRSRFLDKICGETI